MITLSDIYKAVDDGDVFAYNPNNPNKTCPMSCEMKAVLSPIFCSATTALNEKLSKVKLSDVLKKFNNKERRT